MSALHRVELRARNQLRQAEQCWEQFAELFDTLASQHDNTTAGVMANDITDKMRQCRQVFEGLVKVRPRPRAVVDLEGW